MKNKKSYSFLFSLVSLGTFFFTSNIARADYLATLQCSAGYILNAANFCVQETCPEGYYKSGNSCVYNSTICGYDYGRGLGCTDAEDYPYPCCVANINISTTSPFYNCPSGGTPSADQKTCLTSINGVCGSSNNQQLLIKPTTNLCGDGTLPAVNGTSTWTWTCVGANSGTNANCFTVAVGACSIVNKTSSANYSCPDGGILSGTNCNKSSTYSAILDNGTLYDLNIYKYATGILSSSNDEICTGFGAENNCNAWDTPVKFGYIASSLGTYGGSYSCNPGDTLSGSTCTKTTTVPAIQTYACSNVCSSLYNNTQSSFSSSDASCTTPTGAITYSLNCNCGIDATKINLASINSSSCTLCTNTPATNFLLTINAGTNTTVTDVALPTVFANSERKIISLAAGTSVNLSASAAFGSTFKSWGGDGTCAGTENTCAPFIMDKDRLVTTEITPKVCTDNCSTTPCGQSCIKADCNPANTGGTKNCNTKRVNDWREIAP
jgi:hypothetical protein